ncbi:GNAT family acetyltransferase [Thioclava dalianensis]|uniref:GNAT family acetyltransferase n=2 Tax=Thioclava dalianensis TaxID=1185766 RepID=A0A074TIN9_9RHOB|nr:GNAT family acetyltransferase [Thioclava dalianensis]
MRMLKITPITQTDRAAWEPLFRGYCAFYKSDPEPAIAPVWSWICDPQSGLRAALARDASGRALGLVHWEVILRPLKGETICYIHDLFVDPEARGTGAGRALIEHVQGAAREAGAGAVRLATQEGNATARRLYDQFAPASDFILYTFPT